jgi:hypothetical protein
MAIEFPLGTIVAWAKSFVGIPSNLSDGWMEANGQVVSDLGSPLNGLTLPNLNGASSGTQYFLRGCTASGATGGCDIVSHSHCLSGNTDQATASGSYTTGSPNCAIGSHCHGLSGACASTCSPSDLPSYYQVVWLFKIK